MTTAKPRLRLFGSQAHPCPYLPGRTDSDMFLDPAFPVEPRLFHEFVRHGFRRSGTLIYRPQCPSCDACISVRVPARQFRPDRSQRRTWRANHDLHVLERPAAFHAEHFQLYLAYQAGRHPGGAMSDPDPAKYEAILSAPFAAAVLYEMRLQGRLLAVSVADRLDDGLSAVYTFYDPAHAHRSLGTYAILRLVERARELEKDYVYLGYWIEASRKMSYKIRFQPLEGFISDKWISLPRP